MLNVCSDTERAGGSSGLLDFFFRMNLLDENYVPEVSLESLMIIEEVSDFKACVLKKRASVMVEAPYYFKVQKDKNTLYYRSIGNSKDSEPMYVRTHKLYHYRSGVFLFYNGETDLLGDGDSRLTTGEFEFLCDRLC
jgi:hypothetical protein